MPEVIKKLGLDQIRFIIRLKDVNTHSLLHDSTGDACNYKAIREHVHSCTQDWLKGAKHWKTKGSMTKSIYPLDGGSKLTVGYGWSATAKYHFVTFQFNPAKLTSDAACEVLGTFQCMFEWGYEEFIARAECSHVEIAFDVVGVKKTDCLFFDTRLKSHNDSHEKNGTLYLGSRTSTRQWSIYDKAKQIADTGGPVLSQDWLRIEARLDVKVAALALHELSPPFATLRVIDKDRLVGLPPSVTISAFRDRVLNLGFQPQDAFLQSPSKAELLAHLEAAMPDWYDTTDLGKMFPTAAREITAAQVQAIANSPHLTASE